MTRSEVKVWWFLEDLVYKRIEHRIYTLTTQWQRKSQNRQKYIEYFEIVKIVMLVKVRHMLRTVAEKTQLWNTKADGMLLIFGPKYPSRVYLIALHTNTPAPSSLLHMAVVPHQSISISLYCTTKKIIAELNPRPQIIAPANKDLYHCQNDV